LQKSGEVESLTAGLEFSTLRAQEEQDFRNAIEELKKSTAAIEKQSNTLRLQQEAVASLVRNNQQNDDARAVANATQHRQWNTENGQSNTVVRLAIPKHKEDVLTKTAQVDELLQTLQFRISELDTQNKTTSAFLSQAAAEILRADDKLILSLQKLSAELETGNSDDGDKAERIRDLCAR
jgi:ribosomal protein L25 (general stress protein Ctc)